MDAAPTGAARAFVGLGANLGEPRRAIAGAIRAIAGLPGTLLVAVSSLYRSAPELAFWAMMRVFWVRMSERASSM